MISWGRLLRVGPARLLLPAFLLFLSLPLFLIIHSPSTRWTINGYGVLSSTVRATSSSSKLHSRTPKPLKLIPKRHQPYVSTKQYLHGVNYSTRSASGRGLTRAGHRHWRLKKNDRDRNTLNTGNCLRVHSSRVVDSRQNLDANQSN